MWSLTQLYGCAMICSFIQTLVGVCLFPPILAIMTRAVVSILRRCVPVCFSHLSKDLQCNCWALWWVCIKLYGKLLNCFLSRSNHFTCASAPTVSQAGTHISPGVSIVQWYHIVVLICIHCNYEIEYLAMCLLNIHISLIKDSNLLPSTYWIVYLFIMEFRKFFIYFCY